MNKVMNWVLRRRTISSETLERLLTSQIDPKNTGEEIDLLKKVLFSSEGWLAKAKEKLKKIGIPDGTRALVMSDCLLYTSPSPRDATLSRMPSSA